jgi:hypothetical protein
MSAAISEQEAARIRQLAATLEADIKRNDQAGTSARAAKRSLGKMIGSLIFGGASDNDGETTA